MVFPFLYIHIYDLIVLVLQYIYILKAQIMFMVSLNLFQMLIGIYTSLYIDFNWYFNWYLFGIKMYFMFHLQLVSKIYYWYLKYFFKWYQLLFLSTTIWFHWYQNLFCWGSSHLQFDFIGIKICFVTSLLHVMHVSRGS